MRRVDFISTIAGLSFFTVIASIVLWLSTAMIVPYYPFDAKAIAPGICLMIFGLMGAVGIGIGSYFNVFYYLLGYPKHYDYYTADVSSCIDQSSPV